MFKTGLFIFLGALLIVTGSANAQTPTDPLPIRSLHSIESVTLNRPLDDQPWQLQISGIKATGCDLPDRSEWVARDGYFSLLLFHEVAPMQPCPAIAIYFDYTIQLPAALSDQIDAGELPIGIEVNEFVGLIPPADRTPPTILPAMRQELSIDTVSFAEDTAGIALRVAGNQTDGCIDPIGGRITWDWEAEAWEVRAYRVVEPGLLTARSCLAALTPYTLDIRLPADWRGERLNYRAGSISGSLELSDPQIQPRTIRSLHQITGAEVFILESFPEQYDVQVSGYIPDGCSYPTQIEIWRSGFDIDIQIYRELPIDAICTMIVVDYAHNIPLGSLLPSGTYTVTLNDQITLNINS